MAVAREKSADLQPFLADIEYSILLRLPIKSLKRFQCVCKSWFSIISSPLFQNHHFAIAQHKAPLLLTLPCKGGYYDEEKRDDLNNKIITLQCKGGYYDEDKRDDLTLNFSAFNNKILTLVNNFSITIKEPRYKPYMQSCLGLVCLFGRCCNQRILICNPSTQDHISLPTNKGANVSIGFGFGFGFADSTQEFKVVRVYYGGEKFRCEVFTLGALGTGRWRQVRSPVNLVGDGCAPFLHGAVHFMPHVPYVGVKDTDRIIVFDIDSEEYREAIPLPAYYYSLGDCKGRGDFLRISKLGGSLCLTFDYGELRCYLELWLLKDYKSAEWVKAYTIDVSTISPSSSFSFRAYPADTMGDDILLICSDDEGVKILGYDPRDGTLSLKKDEEWAATFYMETFYPLRRRTPT